MHVLAGGARALVVTYFGFYDWTSRGQLRLIANGGASGCAMACCAVSRVSIESDRQIDLS